MSRKYKYTCKTCSKEFKIKFHPSTFGHPTELECYECHNPRHMGPFAWEAFLPALSHHLGGCETCEALMTRNLGKKMLPAEKKIKNKIRDHLKEEKGLKIKKAPSSAMFFMPQNGETEVLKELFERAGIKVTFVDQNE